MFFLIYNSQHKGVFIYRKDSQVLFHWLNLKTETVSLKLKNMTDLHTVLVQV